MWADQEAHFFSIPRAKALKAKARPRAKGIGGKKRLHAHASGRALDRILVTMLGQGLAAFSQKPDDAGQPIDSRPVLIVWMDEGSPTYALSLYLQYATKTRCLFIRDAFHREWNDCTLALRHCGFWPTMLLSQLVFNLPHGPWGGAGWYEQLLQGAESLIRHGGASGGLFSALYDNICADIGVAAAGTHKHKEEVIRFLMDSRVLGKRHEKVATRRWFSWLSAANSNLQAWHSRLLIILFVGIRQGLYKDYKDTPLWGGPTDTPRSAAADDDE